MSSLINTLALAAAWVVLAASAAEVLNLRSLREANGNGTFKLEGFDCKISEGRERKKAFHFNGFLYRVLVSRKVCGNFS